MKTANGPVKLSIHILVVDDEPLMAQSLAEAPKCDGRPAVARPRFRPRRRARPAGAGRFFYRRPALGHPLPDGRFVPLARLAREGLASLVDVAAGSQGHVERLDIPALFFISTELEEMAEQLSRA